MAVNEASFASGSMARVALEIARFADFQAFRLSGEGDRDERAPTAYSLLLQATAIALIEIGVDESRFDEALEMVGRHLREGLPILQAAAA